MNDFKNEFSMDENFMNSLSKIIGTDIPNLSDSVFESEYSQIDLSSESESPKIKKADKNEYVEISNEKFDGVIEVDSQSSEKSASPISPPEYKLLADDSNNSIEEVISMPLLEPLSIDNHQDIVDDNFLDDSSMPPLEPVTSDEEGDQQV